MFLTGWVCRAESTAAATNRLTTLAPPTTARVFIAQDTEATRNFEPRADRIQSLVDRAMNSLTAKSTTRDAWLSLVSTQDTIGIKVFAEPGPNSGTRPAVVAAVVNGLIAAGIPTNHIIIWDRRLIDLRLAGFVTLAKRLGVRAAGSSEAGYDEAQFYETALLGNLVWGDLEFGSKTPGVGRKSFVSKLLSQQITRIINITPLMNHNETGVAGNLFSLALGSVDNVARFESDPDRLARAVPEIYALPALGDRVVLNIVDALICQYEGEERSLLHYSTSLNQLRFSRDPVALDVLSIKELEDQRHANQAPAVKVNLDLYENAALLELGVSELKRIQLITVP
ncbi:MAG: DUF362 domain-containing protein [Verrucomicrobiota bacterium]